MKLNLLDLIDTSGMVDEDKKKWEDVDQALGKACESYIKDEIKIEDLRESIKTAMQSVNEFKKQNAAAVDKKTFEEKISDIEESILKMKAATEVSANGELRVKSVHEQLEMHLKNFLVQKDGTKKVDVEAIKKAGGLKVDLIVKADPQVTTTSGGGVVAGGITIDPNISVAPRRRSMLRELSNVASISTPQVIYAELKNVTGDAGWVPEGGLKPAIKAELDNKTITAGKVAVTFKITTEVMQDIPQLVAELQAEGLSKMDAKEEDGILNGDGQNGNIKGVAADFPAFALTGLEVESPNMYDAIVAAYTQIVSTSNMVYSPNAVRMNPVDYANMQLTKNKNGDYIRPFKVGDELISGLRAVQDPNVAIGSFTMGDFRYLFIRDYVGLTISFGWENDDFTHNRLTVVMEKRLLAYVKAQYKTAFVTDTYANVITAITKSAS